MCLRGNFEKCRVFSEPSLFTQSSFASFPPVFNFVSVNAITWCLLSLDSTTSASISAVFVTSCYSGRSSL